VAVAVVQIVVQLDQAAQVAVGLEQQARMELPELLTLAAVAVAQVALPQVIELAVQAVAALSSSEHLTTLAQYSLAVLHLIHLHRMALTSGR
jgi:hypothetical protein